MRGTLGLGSWVSKSVLKQTLGDAVFAKQNKTADSLRNHKEAKSRTEAWHLCLLFVPILRLKSQR